jgi:hypothetical protein
MASKAPAMSAAEDLMGCFIVFLLVSFADRVVVQEVI